MKKILIALFCLTAALNFNSAAESAVILSTSDTNATAGGNLTLQNGETGKLFIWTSTRPGQTLQALSLNITSTNPSVLQATSSLVYNPAGRWLQTAGGTLGDLVTNQRGATIGAGGINSGALDNYVLFSEVAFNATAEGLTNINLAIGSSGTSVTTGTTFDATFSGGSVTVTAIPEPGSMAAIGMAGAALAYLRRRRQKKLFAIA